MRCVLLIATALLAVTGRGEAAPPTTAEVAAKVDRILTARWRAEKVEPAAAADDAQCARRVYLDLVGRVPNVAEARAFAQDRSADKRARLVAKLLDLGRYASHWATVWRREWLPQADQPQSPLGDEVEGWLAARLGENVPYDRLVRDLLTASPDKGTGDRAPPTFLTAGEFKPENLAGNTTRAFLGVNLDCAQCHNHPFARWTQEQFWEMAAFFARPAGGTEKPVIAIAGGAKTVAPRLLADPQPEWPAAVQPGTGRALLAEWVTAKGNPYFAKNAVNRVWAQLFGTGLVEPLDDLSGENPASHPELLDELAGAFAESGFDLKYLIAAVVQTRAYQLSSVPSGPARPDPRRFACAPVRGLTGEQLYDSLRVAAGLPPHRRAREPHHAALERKGVAQRFRAERAGAAPRSILQSLTLMNGPLTATLTNPETSPTLKAVTAAPFLDTAGKVEALYLAALGRKPTAAESAPLVKYVDRGGPAGAATKALGDVFWALLNSSEFATNH